MRMVEYIKREDALNAIKTAELGEEYEAVEGVRAVDVEERKTGKWLRTPTHWVYCSECGKEPPNETNATTPYCPWCGARMVEDG